MTDMPGAGSMVESVFALIGAAGTALFLVGCLLSSRDEHKKAAGSQAGRGHGQPAATTAQPPQTVAQVKVEHAEVAEQYRRLISELYDFDDRAFSRPGEQP